jgi:hypothetical protein
MLGMARSACPMCRQVASVFQRRRKTASIHADSGASKESQHMAVAYDVVLPFDGDEEGAFKLGEPKEAPDAGFSRAPVGRLASQVEQNDDIQPYRPHCRRGRCDGAGSWASLCRRRCRKDQAMRGRQSRRGPDRGRRRCLLCLHEQEDVSLGDAVDLHLGEFAFQRAKGLLRGSGREEHQIEQGACRAPAGMAGAPIT